MLIIHLAPELESEVRAAAQQTGVAPDHYVANLLREHLSHRGPATGASEAALLKQVNLGLSAATWQRYGELRTKLQDETLTTSEQQELIQITDQLEAANARRIEALVQLSQLRNTTLDALIDELGLRPAAYA
jgi:hypothetical protein